MKNYTNTELLCFAFGWQGGTVHQVAAETGLTVQEIIETNRNQEWIGEETSANGWFAARTCSLEFNLKNNFPKNKGKLSFWMGVAKGIESKLKGI